MSTTSRFHGVTVALVDTGARTIALPSTSIIGLCDTFTVSPAASAKPNDLVLLTSEREAVAAFGEDAAITRAAKAVFLKAKAVIVACQKLDRPRSAGDADKLRVRRRSPEAVLSVCPGKQASGEC